MTIPNHGFPQSEKQFRRVSPQVDDNTIKCQRRVTISSWNPLAGANVHRYVSGTNQAPDRDEVLAMLLQPSSETAKIGRRKTLDTICNTNKSSTENSSTVAWDEVRTMLRKKGVTTNYAVVEILNHRRGQVERNSTYGDGHAKTCDLLSTIGVALLPKDNASKQGQRQLRRNSLILKAKTNDLIMDHTREAENQQKSQNLVETKRRFAMSAATPIKKKRNCAIDWAVVASSSNNSLEKRTDSLTTLNSAVSTGSKSRRLSSFMLRRPSNIAASNDFNSLSLSDHSQKRRHTAHHKMNIKAGSNMSSTSRRDSTFNGKVFSDNRRHPQRRSDNTKWALSAPKRSDSLIDDFFMSRFMSPKATERVSASAESRGHVMTVIPGNNGLGTQFQSCKKHNLREDEMKSGLIESWPNR